MRRSTHHLVVRAYELGRPSAAWRAATALDAADSGLPTPGSTTPGAATRLAEQGLFDRSELSARRARHADAA
jgi:hypothetical protein